MRASPLALLHTAAAHVPRFDAALASLAPSLRADHAVEPGLLEEARARGGVPPALHARVRGTISALLDGGARVVVCTCSTLGESAERAGVELGRAVLRIDGPMAAAAVAGAPRLLVLAALESAVAPACDLLRSAAQRSGRTVEIRSRICGPEVWARFEAGDAAGYRDGIVAAVRVALRDEPAGAPAVVLSQVSMADAVPDCEGLGAKVFCALPSGLEAALARLARPS